MLRSRLAAFLPLWATSPPLLQEVSLAARGLNLLEEQVPLVRPVWQGGSCFCSHFLGTSVQGLLLVHLDHSQRWGIGVEAPVGLFQGGSPLPLLAPGFSCWQPWGGTGPQRAWLGHHLAQHNTHSPQKSSVDGRGWSLRSGSGQSKLTAPLPRGPQSVHPGSVWKRCSG